MRRGHDPRRPVDVQPDVFRRVDDRLAGMDAGPDPNRTAVQGRKRLAHCTRRVRCRRECVEEPVACGIDFITSVAAERIPYDALMLAERGAVALRPEAAEQQGRALDIRE